MHIARSKIPTLKRISTAVVSIGAVVGLAVSVATAGAVGPSTVVVTQDDLANNFGEVLISPDKWFMYNDTTDTIDSTLGSFIGGPDTPPNGNGSVEFTLGASPLNRKNIATYQFSGVKLKDITDLSFVAYSHGGVSGSNESPFLNFNVDFVGNDSWQNRLVYVPSANGSVPQDNWNTFDTIAGGSGLWTWSKYDDNGGEWLDGNTNRYRTWSDILDTWPNAAIRTTDSWLGVRVGNPGPTGYTGNVDALTFGTAGNVTTFDFEPVPPTQVTGLTIFQNGTEIGCDAVVNNRTITVKWDANADAVKYKYQADDGVGSIDFTTNVNTNSRTGDIRDLDGTYNYRLAAVDSKDVQGEWSDWCSVTLDRVAPDVEVTNPADGSTVAGVVDVRGTVLDDNPDHYYLKVAGVGGTVYSHTYMDTTSFTDKSIYAWDTTAVADGAYTIQLEARDAAGGTFSSGNKDAGSVDKVTVYVNNIPDDKDQCKEGGWQLFSAMDFKNQGACVSYVNHNDDNGNDDTVHGATTATASKKR